MDERADRYIKFADSLLAERAKYEGEWRDLANLIMPRFINNMDNDSDDTLNPVHSDDANSCLKRLASAHVSYITPMNSRWFKLEWNNTVTPDASISNWYARLTEIVEMQLSNSNFYSIVQEVYTDRCLTGTGVMLCEPKKDSSGLLFKHIPTGTYAIAENDECVVDTLIRWFNFTAHQAVNMFGIENCGAKILEAYNAPQRRYTDKFKIIHIVQPREKYKKGIALAKDRKFESVYISEQDRIILRESGMYEFPYLVSRFLKWGDSAYGIPPSMDAKPAILENLDMRRMLQERGKVMLYPRVMQTAEDYGEVDFRAGGITLVSRNQAQAGLYPKEWMTQGAYNEGIDLLDRTKERIEKAFFIDMLETISSVDREMTATEVASREGEKAMAFSSSFVQFSSDFMPMMHRIVMVLNRMNLLPEPPQGAVTFNKNHEGQISGYEIKDFQVLYLSRIAQSILRTQQEGLNILINLLGMISQIFGVNVLDVVDVNELANLLFDQSGAPQSIKQDPAKIKQIQEEREQMQNQAMEAQLAKDEGMANRENAVAQQALRNNG